MCYAIPAKIIEIDEDTAKVDYGGIVKKINISLLKDSKIDDFVLVHAGFAIEKLHRGTAEGFLKIIRGQMPKDGR